MAGPSPQILMRTRFGQILMSAACQRINFHWGPLHPDGSAFSFIALALASKPPKGMGVAVMKLAANRGAQYNPTANRIEVPSAGFGNSAFDQMSIVHEATHAIADATTKSSMRGELEETAAFVAGALFNIYSAPALSGPYPFTPAPGSIFQTAHNVAMQIAATPGVALNPQIASPLRQQILGNPTYAFLKTSPRYTHNGVSL
jgi:hypothetical protein